VGVVVVIQITIDLGGDVGYSVSKRGYRCSTSTDLGSEECHCTDRLK
jgi:hypothetical protein